MEQKFFDQFKQLKPEHQDIAIKIQEDLLEDVERELAEQEPLVFTYNGVTYTHIEDTEAFTVDDNEQPITALAVMKAAEPDIVKSLYTKIEPPPDLLKFGKATRRKVIRAAQLYYHEPPIDERVLSFVNFFKYLSSSPRIGPCFAINHYYAASLWATDYNEELATALMLYYGWPPDYRNISMAGTSIHHIEKKPEGILITVCRSHTIQTRLEAACAAIVTEFTSPINKYPPTSEELIKIGMPTFYTYNKTNISISAEIHTAIQNKMVNFIENLTNALTDEIPEYPTIDDPDDFIEDGEYYFDYADFHFLEEATSAQRQQRLNNNEQRVFNTLEPKLRSLPRGVAIPRKEMLLYIEKANLTSGVKYGFLEKPSHGNYMITSKLTLPDSITIEEEERYDS